MPTTAARMPTVYLVVLLAFTALALLCTPSLLAALPPGVTAKVLLRAPLSAAGHSTSEGIERRETVVVEGSIAHNCSTGPHTHPGDEYATVLTGTLELRAAGRPTHIVHPGEAYHNPRGLVHETVNNGHGDARLAITFIVDPGQPLSIPADPALLAQ